MDVLIPDADRIIHEPVRLGVMALLYVVESADFVFIRQQMNLTGGNLSAHIGKLESAGYLKVDKRFNNKRPQTLLSLTDEGRKGFKEYVEAMREFLSGIPL